MHEQFDNNCFSGTPCPPGSDPSTYDGTPGAIRHDFVYDLRLGEERSDHFYAGLAEFSAEVVTEIESRAAPALDRYSHYVASVLCEVPCSRGEYALEFLTIAMILRLYREIAERTPVWVIDLARELFWLRRRNRLMKPVADFLRAGLFRIFMRRNLHRAGSESGPSPQPQSSLAAMPRLLEWLQATGEFEQESKRLNNWQCYWRELPSAAAEDQVAAALALFDWFTPRADQALGKYSAGVIPFLRNTYARRLWREDQIFCGRLPVEYHLGMVAAEVMNNGLREGFQHKPRKVVLVPTCMRGARSESCRAVVRGLDMMCTACDPACGVNRITRRMREEGVEVYMVPHASSFSRWLERWQDDRRVGVAAVACMMNILPGGYEMRARGIASQCVPLDHPGCAKHWSQKAIPTSLNEERLVQIVTGPK